MQGYQASCLQDGGCSAWKDINARHVLKRIFYSNYPTCYSGTKTQRSQIYSKLLIHMIGFRYRMIVRAQPKNHLLSLTK